MDQLTFRIVLPSSTLVSLTATMVTATGQDGVFSVLPGHMQLVVNLKAGIADVYGGNIVRRFFIHNGIAMVDNSSVSIITEFALELTDQGRDLMLVKINALQNDLTQLAQDSPEQQVTEHYIKLHQTALEFA